MSAVTAQSAQAATASPCPVRTGEICLAPTRQSRAERLGDVRLVVLREAGVERKRERARGDVLGDRAEADAIAEPLLHVRLEVDARQVASGLHSAIASDAITASRSAPGGSPTT